MLQTVNVFLDSEVYIRASFNINSVSFQKLRELCQNDELKLFITDIVKEECVARIERNIEESLNSLKTFQRKACIASSSETHHYFSKLSAVQLLNEAKSNFLNFLEECKTIELSCDIIKPSEVFSLYFKQEKPFGKGKKKNEFPDAFSLKTIEKAFEKSDESIYLISGDLDFEGIQSKNFIYLNTVEKLLELQNENQTLISDLKHIIKRDEYLIKKKVTSKLENFGIEYINYTNREIRVIDIKLPAPQVIRLEDHTAIISYNNICVFHYIGTSELLDLDNIDVVDYELDTQKYLSNIDVTFEVDYELNSKSSLLITSINLITARAIRTNYFEEPNLRFK